MNKPLQTIDCFILPIFDCAAPTHLVIKILFSLTEFLPTRRNITLERLEWLLMAYLPLPVCNMYTLEGIYKEMSLFC